MSDFNIKNFLTETANYWKGTDDASQSRTKFVGEDDSEISLGPDASPESVDRWENDLSYGDDFDPVANKNADERYGPIDNSDEADIWNPGDKVHLGFGAKGGAGYNGVIDAIDGDTVIIVSDYDGNKVKGRVHNLSTMEEPSQGPHYESLEDQYVAEYDDWDEDEYDELSSATITGKLPDKSYWNSNGKHQDKSDKLRKLIPDAGEVVGDSPELEKYRLLGNAYYDVYNNGSWEFGQGQRGDQFDQATGLGIGDTITTNELETLVDRQTLMAWREQVKKGVIDESMSGSFATGPMAEDDMGIDQHVEQGDFINVAEGEAQVVAVRGDSVVAKMPNGMLKLLSDSDWWLDDENIESLNEIEPADGDEWEDQEEWLDTPDFDIGQAVSIPPEMGGTGNIIAVYPKFAVVGLSNGKMKTISLDHISDPDGEDENDYDPGYDYEKEEYADSKYNDDDEEPAELSFEGKSFKRRFNKAFWWDGHDKPKDVIRKVRELDDDTLKKFMQVGLNHQSKSNGSPGVFQQRVIRQELRRRGFRDFEKYMDEAYDPRSHDERETDQQKYTNHDFKRREMSQELRGEEGLNAFGIFIDGKFWKAVKNENHASAIVNTLQKKGKDAKFQYGAYGPVTEAANLNCGCGKKVCETYGDLNEGIGSSIRKAFRKSDNVGDVVQRNNDKVSADPKLKKQFGWNTDGEDLNEPDDLDEAYKEGVLYSLQKTIEEFSDTYGAENVHLGWTTGDNGRMWWVDFNSGEMMPAEETVAPKGYNEYIQGQGYELKHWPSNVTGVETSVDEAMRDKDDYNPREMNRAVKRSDKESKRQINKARRMLDKGSSMQSVLDHFPAVFKKDLEEGGTHKKGTKGKAYNRPGSKQEKKAASKLGRQADKKAMSAEGIEDMNVIGHQSVPRTKANALKTDGRIVIKDASGKVKAAFDNEDDAEMYYGTFGWKKMKSNPKFTVEFPSSAMTPEASVEHELGAGEKKLTELEDDGGFTTTADQDRELGEPTMDPEADMAAFKTAFDNNLADRLANDKDTQDAIAQMVQPDDQPEEEQISGDEIDQLKNLLGIMKVNEGSYIRYVAKAKANMNPYTYALSFKGKKLTSSLLHGGIERGYSQGVNKFIRKWIDIQENDMGEEIDDAGNDLSTVQKILDKYQQRLNKAIEQSRVM